jgi:hypothetical protein
MATGSNGQRNQHHNTEPDSQHRKRDGIIIKSVPALYTHDNKPEAANSAAP